MGRPKAEIDELELFDLLVTGETQKQMAEELGVSVPTLAKKIARLQEEQGILTQYRTLQSLELTSLENKILSAITPDKIEGAELKDLIYAFKVLKEKEHIIEGKPTEINGLIGYLEIIEKERVAAIKQPFRKEEEEGDYVDVNPEVDDNNPEEEFLPHL